MELNKKKFIEEILNLDFKGDEKECALALGMDANYFRLVLLTRTKKGGPKLLGSIYQYCRKTGRDPEPFIFFGGKNFD